MTACAPTTRYLTRQVFNVLNRSLKSGLALIGPSHGVALADHLPGGGPAGLCALGLPELDIEIAAGLAYAGQSRHDQSS